MRLASPNVLQGARSWATTVAGQETSPSSGSTYTFASYGFQLNAGIATVGEVGPGTVGMFAIYACSGASSRTFSSVTCNVTGGGASIALTELVKIDGVANFLALYAADLKDYENYGGTLNVDIAVTLSGTITNGLAIIGTCVTGIDSPMAYSTGSSSSGDPNTLSMSYNGRGIIAYAATSNNTTAAQEWYRVTDTDTRIGSYAGGYASQYTYGSRRHILGFLGRLNYTTGAWDGLEHLGLDTATSITVGVDYSSTGTSPTDGTVLNPRLVAVSFE